MNVRAVAFSCFFLAPSALAQMPHRIFHIQAGPAITQPVSGRLLLFMRQGSGDTRIDADPEAPMQTWVAAQEVHDLQPGGTVDVDADQIAFPQPFSKATGAGWQVQAVLDVDHTYNYGGRTPSDWQSAVAPLEASGQTLSLSSHAEEDALHKTFLSFSPQAGVVEDFSMQSPSLTSFWGRPMYMRGAVVLPPGYNPAAKQTWPTSYQIPGFGTNAAFNRMYGFEIRKQMENGRLASMIYVVLDESLPEGTHEFTDSVNDGPWGTALTTEFLPTIEKKYRMDAKPSGRFLTGHSSGAWASLQLEMNYPRLFAGAWPTSPDPSDFHDFSGTDLYAPHANVYRRPDGSPRPLVRVQGKVMVTFEQYAKLEAVLGPYGGQVSSFDWVFSPKGPSGAPEPMFDRTTGDVNPEVVQYWHDHYDLAAVAERDWAKQGKALKGHIHLWVGTADTYYLDGAAHLLQARLQKLGAAPDFTFVPGASHHGVSRIGNDPRGLDTVISQQMYAIARPRHPWTPTALKK